MKPFVKLLILKDTPLIVNLNLEASVEKHQARKLQTLRKLLLITSFTLPSFSFGADKLPEKIDWQTAKNVQPIGSPQAKKGGTIYDYLLLSLIHI